MRASGTDFLLEDITRDRKIHYGYDCRCIWDKNGQYVKTRNQESRSLGKAYRVCT